MMSTDAAFVRIDGATIRERMEKGWGP